MEGIYMLLYTVLPVSGLFRSELKFRSKDVRMRERDSYVQEDVYGENDSISRK